MFNTPATSVAETALIPEVDLHCHILPHWDDGPQAVEESLRMAEKAAGLGVKRILVTPHVGRAFGRRPEPPSSNIAMAISHLQDLLDETGIVIELVQGAELTLSSIGFVAYIIEEPWLAFGTSRRYVLVESPFHFWPEWADQVLFELSLQNIIPIIAHPERLADAQKDVDFMRGIVERGALLQITARSLVGSQRVIQDCCRRLLEAGLVSVVASDAHSSRHLMSREIEAKIVEVVGVAAARQILVENPQAILAGDVLGATLPPEPPRKRGFSKFFARG